MAGALCADGGASANGFLMQFQADILGAEVARPASMETTARGAAYLAGQTCGLYGEPLLPSGEEMTVFTPQMDDARRAETLRAWEEALSRDKFRAKL